MLTLEWWNMMVRSSPDARLPGLEFCFYNLLVAWSWLVFHSVKTYKIQWQFAVEFLVAKDAEQKHTKKDMKLQSPGFRHRLPELFLIWGHMGCPLSLAEKLWDMYGMSLPREDSLIPRAQGLLGGL